MTLRALTYDDPSPLAYALRYAEIGWRVFPVHSVRDGLCSCGNADCAHRGKHPRIRSNLTRATTDPDKIREWWTRWPDANVAVATGEGSGFYVVDVDPRNGGDATYIDLGEPDAEVRQRSGGGGDHLCYASNGRRIPSKNGVLPGIDIKGEGGYFIVAPSGHELGGEYVWLDGQDPLDGAVPGPAPVGLIELLLPPEREERAAPSLPSLAWERCEDLVREALPHIPSDDRDIWLRVGMALKRTGGGDEAYAAWEEWSKTSAKFDDTDQRRTWASITETHDRPVTVRSIFHQAQQHGWECKLDISSPRDDEHDLDELREGLDVLLEKAKAAEDPAELYGAANLVAQLPATERLIFIGEAKAALGTKFSKTGFERAVREEMRARDKEEKEQLARDAAERRRERIGQANAKISAVALATERKRIDLFDAGELAREPLDIHNESLQALVAKNKDRERIFSRGTHVWRGVRNEAGEPSLEHIGENELQAELLDAALYIGRSKYGDPQPSNPPKAVLHTILGSSKLPFPTLRAIVQAPVLRPDGSILIKPGYDKATELLYIPSRGLEIRRIPEQPDADELREAVAILKLPFSQFPYVDRPSEANVLGLCLTGFVQPLVQSHRPMCVAYAAQPGSGKTVIVDSCATILTGRESSKRRLRRDEEFEKKLGELLQRGAQFICVDNAKNRLESATLESILTSRRHADRILGANDRGFDVPQEAVWCASGNSLELGSEMARRAYPILLDPKHPRPDEREGPREGEKFINLATWIPEHRGELIWAVLTLCRAWHVARRPEPDLPPFGSFEEWQTVVGGILEFAGVENFLANRSAFRKAQDEEAIQAEALLRFVHRLWGSTPFTSGKAVDAIEGHVELVEGLPSSVACGWEGPRARRAQLLGTFFRGIPGRRFADDGLRVERVEDDGHVKVGRWRVVTDA